MFGKLTARGLALQRVQDGEVSIPVCGEHVW